MEQMRAPQNWQVGVFEGPDAADFLQRLSTAHVRELDPGAQAVSATFLNAQGRIQAAFWLSRLAADKFLLASADLAAVAEFIERYTFAEKQTFQIQDLAPALWIWSSAPEADLPFAVAQAAFHMSHGDREWDAQWWSAWGIAELPGVHTLTAEEFTARRITHGIPWWGSEITTETSPLEIHFQNAIAANKGCYPGQEVIERTLSIGAPARRLCRVQIPAGQSAPEGWTITTAAVTPASGALALLRKTQAVAGATSNGAQCLEVFGFQTE